MVWPKVLQLCRAEKQNSKGVSGEISRQMVGLGRPGMEEQGAVVHDRRDREQ